MTTLELELEKVESLYINRKELKKPAYSLYRIDGGESRWYYREDKDRYFPSVTSVIQATCPTPPALIQWMKSLGDKADLVRDQKAEYGTMMHVIFSKRLIDGTLDVSTIEPMLRLCAADNGWMWSELEWMKWAKQDVLAFEQFIRDHSIVPIAIEAVLTSEAGYAGAVDLLCTMRIGSGQSGKFLKKDQKLEPDPSGNGNSIQSLPGEEITALVDYKTGRKGFYVAHEIQLHMYKDMVAENFGVKVDRVFNWSPSDWRTAPTYKLKDQTDSKHAAKIPHLLQIFAINGRTGPSDSLILKGTIDPEKPLSDFYGFEGMRERIKKGL